MRIKYSYAHLALIALSALAAGCGSQGRQQVVNPIADELRAQAHALSRQSQACREDVAEYRAQQQAPLTCGGNGFEQVGESSYRLAGTCVVALLAAVPACRRWAHSYAATVTASVDNGSRAQNEIEEMEIEELGRPY